MAELPDLTVFAKTLNHYFKGHPLKHIDVTVAKKLNVSEKELISYFNQKQGQK